MAVQTAISINESARGAACGSIRASAQFLPRAHFRGREGRHVADGLGEVRDGDSSQAWIS